MPPGVPNSGCPCVPVLPPGAGGSSSFRLPRMGQSLEDSKGDCGHDSWGSLTPVSPQGSASRPVSLAEGMVALFFYQIHSFHLPSPYMLAPTF